MRTIIVATVIALTMVLAPARAEPELDQHKKALIDEMLEVSGALNISRQMAEYVIGAISNAVRAVDQERTDEFHDIVRDSTMEILDEEMSSGSFNEMLYPIYDKYLSVEDLEATVKFYKSDAGRRMMAAMPAMMQEAMAAGQQWGQVIGTRAQERIESRARDRGIEISQ